MALFVLGCCWLWFWVLFVVVLLWGCGGWVLEVWLLLFVGCFFFFYIMCCWWGCSGVLLVIVFGGWVCFMCGVVCVFLRVCICISVCVRVFAYLFGWVCGVVVF